MSGFELGTPGLDAFSAAEYSKAEEIDPSLRFTEADPQCIDHPSPERTSDHQEPIIRYQAGVIYNLQTGKPRN